MSEDPDNDISKSIEAQLNLPRNNRRETDLKGDASNIERYFQFGVAVIDVGTNLAVLLEIRAPPPPTEPWDILARVTRQFRGSSLSTCYLRAHTLRRVMVGDKRRESLPVLSLQTAISRVHDKRMGGGGFQVERGSGNMMCLGTSSFWLQRRRRKILTYAGCRFPARGPA